MNVNPNYSISFRPKPHRASEPPEPTLFTVLRLNIMQLLLLPSVGVLYRSKGKRSGFEVSLLNMHSDLRTIALRLLLLLLLV